MTGLVESYRYRRVAALLGLLLTLAGCGTPATPIAESSAPASRVASPATSSAASAEAAVAPTTDSLNIPLTVPAGFRIRLVAHDLGEARMIAFNGNGVPYVTIMNRGRQNGGKVVALFDRDGDGTTDDVTTVLDGLDRPHGLVWHDDHMYVSETSRILRLIDDNQDAMIERVEPIVEGMPTAGDHWARPFLFDANNDVVVAIGSTCNICQEGDKTRASIRRYSAVPERNGIVARGLRSVVGLAWRPGTDELWASNNARDGLGPDLPADTLFQIEQDQHYGWPYCYGNRVPDPEVVQNPDIVTPDRTPKNQFCETQVAPPALELPPHVAPLGMTFYDADQFPEAYRGGLFMAWHGAWDKANQNGYRVAFAPLKDGAIQPPQDFVTGWLKPGTTDWYARPTNVAIGPDGSLYIVEDVNGNVYRVDYVGAP